MKKSEQEQFRDRVQEAWDAIKRVCDKRYHQRLRNTMLKIIAKEDEQFPKFVDLMKASGWDPIAAQLKKKKDVNAQLDEAAADNIDITRCASCSEFMRVTDATETPYGKVCPTCAAPNDPEEEPVLHRCHYCGEMYPVADLRGAKEGLMCYKCSHERENRD